MYYAACRVDEWCVAHTYNTSVETLRNDDNRGNAFSPHNQKELSKKRRCVSNVD